jgi:hypothetical protein
VWARSAPDFPDGAGVLVVIMLRWRRAVQPDTESRNRPGRGSRGRNGGDPGAESAADLAERNFRPAEPDRLYVADITPHRTWPGCLYVVVLNCFPRRVVGWAMADPLSAELVVDSLQSRNGTDWFPENHDALPFVAPNATGEYLIPFDRFSGRRCHQRASVS